MANSSTVIELVPEGDEATFSGSVGAFRVDVREGDQGGTITLVPQDGASVELVIRGNELTMRWGGPLVRLEAPGADLTLAAKNLHLRAEESVTVEARREVDIHSGVDVEVRADHHVNLWGHGVLVGD
jgi:hypothetical protein